MPPVYRLYMKLFLPSIGLLRSPNAEYFPRMSRNPKTGSGCRCKTGDPLAWWVKWVVRTS